MKLYLEPSGRRIKPFDDPIGESLIQNRPLSSWQAEAFQEAGLELIEAPQAPCLILPDTFFGTGSALIRFLEASQGQNATLLLARSRFGSSSVPLQPHVEALESGWRFEKIRFMAKADPEAPYKDVLLDPEEEPFDLPAPKHYLGRDTLEMGVPRHAVMTLHHWVHLLWANQLAGSLEAIKTPKWRWAARILWAILRARSLNKWRVLGKLNRLGRGCDIHPSAVVEGSTLGDGVTVGPHARVLLSTLGDGAEVMSGAQVDLSVIAEKAVVSEQCVIRFSVLYPGAVASQLLMQQCVLGRDAVVTKGSVSIDLNFSGEIKLPLDGRVRSSGTPFLGSAYGHRCRVGTGFFISSGRAIPNDYFLLRDPRQILSVIPPGLEGQPLNASGRKLKRLGF